MKNMVFTNDKFILHLKECEYRYNNRKLNKKEFEKMILKLTKNYLKNKERGKLSSQAPYLFSIKLLTLQY
jgi:hypothetical protein